MTRTDGASLRRRVAGRSSVLAIALALMAGLPAGGAQAAGAEPAGSTDDPSCSEPWGNPAGYSDVAYPVGNNEGRRLRLVNNGASDWSYAVIKAGYRSGDLVWVNRSRHSNGAGYTQCAPTPGRAYSKGLYNTGWYMRACMKLAGSGRVVCTNWYYDKE